MCDSVQVGCTSGWSTESRLLHECIDGSSLLPPVLLAPTVALARHSLLKSLAKAASLPQGQHQVTEGFHGTVAVTVATTGRARAHIGAT